MVHPDRTGTLGWMLLGLPAASIASLAVYLKTVKFPNYPRMTLDELDVMRKEMGLPAHVFQQTHDSVLHGSGAEIDAGTQADALIQKLKSQI